MIDPSAQSAPPALQSRPRGIRSWQLLLQVQPNIALASALLFAAGLALRVYRLGAQSLWLDEGGTWAEVTGQGWAKLLADLWSTNAAYPLYHLLLKGWVALVGDSEWALRFPSALSGAVAVVAIFFAALELERFSVLGERRMAEGRDAAAAAWIRPSSSVVGPMAAALLFMFAPFAVW